MDRKLSLEELHQQLDETIEQVYHRGDQVIVERNGEAVAAMVPVQRYKALRESRARLWALIDRARESNADVDPPEIEAAIERSLDEVRTARPRRTAGRTRAR